MPNLTSAQAKELSKNFFGLAQAIGDYRYENHDTLSKAELQTLADQQWSVLNAAQDFLALSTALLMDDVSNALVALTNVTEDIKSSIQRIQMVQKVINVAAAVVQLGGAIISKSPDAIAQSLQKLIDTWQQSVGDNL